MRNIILATILCLFQLACSKSGPMLLNEGSKTPVQYGDSVQVPCGVKNAGKPFKGLKTSLAGDAFDKNLVSAPKSMAVELWDMSATPQKKVTATFVQSKGNSWVAELPELEVDQPSICFDLCLPASCSGSGQVKVTVGSLDGKGTDAIFLYPCTVDSMQVARAREEREQAELARRRDLASPPVSLSSLTTGKIKIDPNLQLQIQADQARSLEIKSRDIFKR